MLKRFFLGLFLMGWAYSVLAQDSPYARYATPVELLASGTLSTNRGAWVSGATNAYDNYGMIYAYCSTCSDATNGARTVLLPPSGVGRWIATVKPPSGGWGTGGGGGNVFTGTTNPQSTIPTWGTGNTNLTDTLISVSGQTNLLVPKRLLVGGAAFRSEKSIVEIQNDYGFDSGEAVLVLRTAITNDSNRSELRLEKSRGTYSAPLAILAGDYIGELVFAGHDGTDFRNNARVESGTISNWTATSHSTFLDFRTTADNSTNTSERMRITAAGWVGIGTNTPASQLELSGDDAEVFVTRASGSPSMRNRRARGSTYSPAILQNADVIGNYSFWGYDGVTYQNRAMTRALVNGAVSAGVVPMDLQFFAGSSASTERARITSAGNFGIGTTAPAEMFSVSNLFLVTANGDLSEIRNVPYSWPTTNALAGQLLQSDASGNLSWTNGVSSVNTIVSTKTLTDNVATDVFTVALAALARSGLEVRFEIDVTNGTDTQTFTDTRRVSAVNKAGTVTSALSASASATATSSADTLNVTVAISSNATTYTFVVTADTSLGTPTLTMRYTILNFNGATITLL
jgi:hypothetical protein